MKLPRLDRKRIPVVLALVAVTCLSANAQTTVAANKKTTAGAPRNGREVTVQETFDPSFSIEPLFHKIEARIGDLVTFKFKVQSNNRAAKIEVAAIGLRQEMNGQILHDEQAEKSDSIRLISPSKMDLVANTPTWIEGIVRIPKGDAKQHSLGILVRDIGTTADIKPKFNPDGTQQTQAGIQFVTQYVLRLDLTVAGARGEFGNELIIEDVQMVSFEGRPQLRATVLNPSDTTFEFELRGQLRSSPSDRSMKPLRMTMPVRKEAQDAARYVGRILPKTRILMEELLPEAIGGGSYEAEMEVLAGGKTVSRKSLSIDVNASDYPAQEVLIAQVDQGLQVSPAQIELSKARGGNRRLTMILKNTSRETKTISLKAIADNELEINAVLIQPNEFQLPPGGNRKIALTLRTLPSDGRTFEYGLLRVEASSTERDYEVTRDLPLAILLKDVPEAEIAMRPLQWSPDAPYPSFIAKIENSGLTHLALNARLSIVDSTGRRMSIPGGFGRWLMPQRSTTIDFRLNAPLIPGEYLLKCEVQRQGAPLVVEQSFTVTDLENASASLN